MGSEGLPHYAGLKLDSKRYSGMQSQAGREQHHGHFRPVSCLRFCPGHPSPSSSERPLGPSELVLVIGVFDVIPEGLFHVGGDLLQAIRMLL